MVYSKTFDNGLKLIIDEMVGVLSVSCGILVKTGSANETEDNNGISHFIEHTVFKGTSKRSAFEISDFTDRIGAQINAFTSKEMTCFYTKSTKDHLYDSLEVLSDIFFNSTFKKEELEKEKGVIIEEINMNEDSPEDLCFDLLAESFYGKNCFGRTILGPAKNIKKFNKDYVDSYMQDYYTADNVVISIAGNVDIKNAENLVKELFSENFKYKKSKPQVKTEKSISQSLHLTKKIEQTHIGFSIPSIDVMDERKDAINIANIVYGGGMSSRLFQKIREDMGLCYNVYSCISAYKDSGVLEIYAGVNTEMRDIASKAIIEETVKFRNGITESEFLRGKEQVKSSLILGQESTASQMILFGRVLLFQNEVFDFNKRLEFIENISLEETNKLIYEFFKTDNMATATVGPKRSNLQIK